MSIQGDFVRSNYIKVLAYRLGSKNEEELSSGVLHKDLDMFKAMLESDKASFHKMSSKNKGFINKSEMGWRLLTDKLQISMFERGSRLIKKELDYGKNTPRYLDLYGYVCGGTVVYFVRKSEVNIGDIEYHTVGTGVSWGNDFYWDYIVG